MSAAPARAEFSEGFRRCNGFVTGLLYCGGE
jgi:hypothetical protein